MNAILSFSAFDSQVRSSAGSECADLLERIISGYIDKQLIMGPNSNSDIKSLFQADPKIFTDDNDFRFLVADIAAESIQYGYQEQLCQMLKNVTTSTTTTTSKEDEDAALTKAYAQFTSEVYYPNFGDNSGYSYAIVVIRLLTWRVDSSQHCVK